MKFRARMVEVLPMKKFYNVLQSMAKLTKLCVLRLTATKVYFIASEPSVPGGHLPTGGPSIWCELDQASFFNEYRLEGVTPDHPEIYLELETDKLLKALSLIKSTRALKMKLTKKHDQPCLSLDMDLTASCNSTDNSVIQPLGNARQCVHDVPVNVLPRRSWSEYGEPVMKKPNISIYLPDLKRLKHLTERYKNLGNYVVLEAHSNGKLIFKLESDQVTVSTHFQNLEVAADQSDALTSGGDDSPASVRVDLRSLSLYLSADHLAPKRMLANLVTGKVIHLFLIQDSVFFQFYLPSILE